MTVIMKGKNNPIDASILGHTSNSIDGKVGENRENKNGGEMASPKNRASTLNNNGEARASITGQWGL